MDEKSNHPDHQQFMKTVIIGFSRPISPSVYAKLIMWVDKIQYDHAYLRWTWSEINRDLVYQASKLAVNYESGETFKSHALPVEEYSFELDDASFMKLMQFCVDTSDKPYGIMEILGFGYVKLLAAVGLKVNNPFPSDGETYFCSQLVQVCLQQVGKLESVDNSANTDPLALNQMVKSLGFKRIL